APRELDRWEVGRRLTRTPDHATLVDDVAATRRKHAGQLAAGALWPRGPATVHRRSAAGDDAGRARTLREPRLRAGDRHRRRRRVGNPRAVRGVPARSSRADRT